MRRIVVEDSLKNVQSYLKGKGYTVESLKNNKINIDSYDAVIVSGQDSNFLGMQDTSTKASVINAKGLSAEDVHKQLENTMR